MSQKIADDFPAINKRLREIAPAGAPPKLKCPICRREEGRIREDTANLSRPIAKCGYCDHNWYTK